MDYVTPEILDWLRTLPSSLVIAEDLFLYHGELGPEEHHLLEEVTRDGGGRLRGADEVEQAFASVTQSVVLCGHSHVPRVVSLPGGNLW